MEMFMNRWHFLLFAHISLLLHGELDCLSFVYSVWQSLSLKLIISSICWFVLYSKQTQAFPKEMLAQDDCFMTGLNLMGPKDT
jgi:hypothetical protein